MKAILFVAAILVAGVAQADPKPTYLGEARGVVLNSITSTDQFSFAPGTLGKCSRKTLSDWVIYKCEVTGAQATVDSGSRARTFNFHTVQVWFRYHKSVGYFNEYHFVGDWTEKGSTVSLDSEVRMTLWHKRKEPGNIKGSISLRRYDLTLPVQATQ